MRKTILAVSGLVFGITACSSYDTSNTIPTERIPVASIAVTLPSPSLLPGQTQRAIAAARDASGAPLSDRPIVWQSSLPSIATVDNTGEVSAVIPGATIITASSEGVSGQSALTVMAPSPIPVASVAVTPATASLLVGATVQLSAVARDAAGNAMSGKTVTWSSSNGAIASVSASGLASALAVGTADIAATVDGVAGHALLTVGSVAPVLQQVTLTPASVTVAAGATQQFSVALGWSDGASRSVPVNFSATGGTISTAGLFTAGSVAGTYRVIAREPTSGLADTSSVVVSAPPPTAVLHSST